MISVNSHENRSVVPNNTMTKGEYERWVEEHHRVPTWPAKGRRQTKLEVALAA